MRPMALSMGTISSSIQQYLILDVDSREYPRIHHALGTYMYRSLFLAYSYLWKNPLPNSLVLSLVRPFVRHFTMSLGGFTGIPAY